MRTIQAAIQAITHCMITTPSAHFPPSSRLTEEMAATQGVYSSVNTRNTTAVSGVKSVERALVEPPSRTVRVETTLSLALNPVIRAVAIFQSQKPSGQKIGAMSPASTASRLVCESDTTFSRASKL